MDNEDRSFWKNPWVIGIGAPLIVALILAVAHGFGSPAPVPSPTSTVSPATNPSSSLPGTPSASTPSASPTAAKNTPLAIYYQRPIPVGITSGGSGLDFDIKPPGPGPGSASFFYNTFALQKGGSSTVGFGFAVWMKGRTPTASDCQTWVSTHLAGDVYDPTAGMKICFRTDQGRIGLLIVQPGTSENQFNAIARVWGS